MSRLNFAVTSAAALASAGLLVIGPTALAGSARSDTAAAIPASCAPPTSTGGRAKAISGSTTHGDMAGMAGMAANPTHHSTQELRDRLAHTPSGGTLTVQPGVYRGKLVIDHPVTLVGIGHPILHGDGTGTVLTIRAAGTTVRDLMIEGSGPGPVDNPAGVSVQADRVVVKHLHIRDTYTGIWVEGVEDAQVIGNVIEGRKAVAVSGETPRTNADMDMSDMAGMVMGAGKSAARAGRGDGVSLFNAIRPLVSGNATHRCPRWRVPGIRQRHEDRMQPCRPWSLRDTQHVRQVRERGRKPLRGKPVRSGHDVRRRGDAGGKRHPR